MKASKDKKKNTDDEDEVDIGNFKMSSETISNLGGAKKPGGVLGGLKKSNNTNFMDDEEDEEVDQKGKKNNKFGDDDDEDSFEKSKGATKKPVTAASATNLKIGGKLLASATGSDMTLKGLDNSKGSKSATASKYGGGGDQDEDEESEEEEEDNNKQPAKVIPKGGFGKAPISVASSQSSSNNLGTVGGKNQPVPKGPIKGQTKKVVEESEEEEEEEDPTPKKGFQAKTQGLVSKPGQGKKPTNRDDESEEEDNGNFFNPAQSSLKKPNPPAPANKKPQKKEESEEEDSEESEKPKIVSKKQPPPKGGNKPQSDYESDGQMMQQMEAKKKKRKSIKSEHYFNFADDNSDDDGDEVDGSSPSYLEEGISLSNVKQINAYYAQEKIVRTKQTHKKKKMAKQVRYKNLFFTSRCFMLYHFVQNLIFWLLVIIFPAISVTGCVTGFQWMSHVAMAIYCGLSFVFDCVFAGQYIEREGLKFDLKAFRNGQVDKSGRCKFMFMTFLESFFEMLMTQIALFDIYTDVAFTALTYHENISPIWQLSLISNIAIALPKIYSMGVALMLMFGCTATAREEDSRRKYAHRVLIFNESRMQALNLEYTRYQREKVDLLMAFFKFFLEDAPQFLFQLYYLTLTDCGKKNPNLIIYVGLIMAVLNTYFGLFYRLLSCCYVLRRLNSYKRKVEVRVSNLQLANFGYKNIRNKLNQNRNVESVVLTGEAYEYMVANQKSVGKLKKCLAQFADKDKIEFVEINKMRMQDLRSAKTLIFAMDEHFPKLMYLTLQQCSLPENFIKQFKNFLNANDTLVRLSVLYNQLTEEDCLEIIETALDHPELEILQIADKFKNENANSDDDAPPPPSKKKGVIPKYKPLSETKISLCRGIQVRLQQNESLKKLELRYVILNRQLLQALFKGLEKNKSLQKLILSHDSLNEASVAEFSYLGQSLKSNTTLLLLDLSRNSHFDENLEYHSEITNHLINSPKTAIRKIYVTVESIDIKALYLELLDQKQNIRVINEGRMLDDVDVPVR